MLEAVYERQVPETIYNQIRDSVFRSDVIRVGWTLEINVLDPEQNPVLYGPLRTRDGGANLYIVDSIIQYDLQNLCDGSTQFRVTGGIDLDVPAGDLPLPWFKSLKIGDTVWDDELSDDRARAVHSRSSTAPLREGLTIDVTDDLGLLFSKVVDLPRDKLTRVRFRTRRAIRAPGMYVLSCSHPADGISIEIIGIPELRFEVRPLHSQAAWIEHPSAGSWKLPFGILPWQGFQIVSHAAQPAPSATEVARG